MAVKYYSDDYARLRSKIKNGDVVFIKNGHEFFSKIIHFMTFSRYSHVGIAVWVTIEQQRRLMIVEAQGGTKKRIINMSMYDGCEMDVYRHPNIRWEWISNGVLDRLGVVEYGWIQAIYVGIREYFMKRWGVRLPSKNFSGMICSEFVANVYGLEDTNISPQVLYEELLERGFIHIDENK